MYDRGEVLLSLRWQSPFKGIIEPAPGAGMTHHLGYAPGTEKPAGSTNHRNGSSGKTVITDDGPLRIEMPGDRHGAFEPQIVGKHERRFTGLRVS